MSFAPCARKAVFKLPLPIMQHYEFAANRHTEVKDCLEVWWGVIVLSN